MRFINNLYFEALVSLEYSDVYKHFSYQIIVSFINFLGILNYNKVAIKLTLKINILNPLYA